MGPCGTSSASGSRRASLADEAAGAWPRSPRPPGERLARPPGSHKAHVTEQEGIVAEALRATAGTPVAVRQAAPATY